MSPAPTLRTYLEGPMLRNARDGSFNFLNVLKSAVEEAGWRVEWLPTGKEARESAPSRDGYALFHAEAPTHDRAMTFRRAYHYPFWQIETVPQRWRFDVAHSTFDPDQIDPDKARRFADRLRARVIPGPDPKRDGTILVPLQGIVGRCRSFQTMSPLEMLERVAATGKPVRVTLHPGESYNADDLARMQALVRRYRNMSFAPLSLPVLRDCDFVATQNSAVAFDGYLLGKPAVLFAQIDFHHIGLNVADLGATAALAQAAGHRPDFDRYIYWFLQEKAVNATLPDARERIRAAMRKGGWPI